MALQLSAYQISGGLFIIVLAFWAIFTLVAIYHWMRYSHAALFALPSIIVYLAVSGILILFIWQALAAV